MGGGLMQLVAYGAQDIYLTGNPQITFFKVVYRRHTNFSMEAIEQTFNGTEGFGQSVTATISRNGDLVHRMYLEHDLTYTAPDTLDGKKQELVTSANYGNRLMKDVELEIGGQRIDRHYGHWMSVWSQLTEDNPTGTAGAGTPSGNGDEASGSRTLFDKMSGNGQGAKTMEADSSTTRGAFTCTNLNATTAAEVSGKIFVPLQFWFCRNPGLALPLIALQYHEVKVKITFEGIGALLGYDADNAPSALVAETSLATTTTSFKLWADYIYLDTDERRRFAQVSHEYLIEQVQHAAYSSGGTMTLNFNHPVKELVWSKQLPDSIALTTNSDVIKVGSEEPIGDGTFILKLNGHDRFSERNTKYFTRAQVWQHHTGYGSNLHTDGIAVYSFALKPEEHQPSGTCNFSRIDNAQLIATNTSDNYNVYAVNYNVLRIMSGMGGLAYSNQSIIYTKIMKNIFIKIKLKII